MNEQIVVNGSLISYSKIKGQGNGPALLFLHGWRSNKEVWQTVIKHLIIKSFDLSIYAMDLPGFGGSPAPNPHPSPLPEGEGGWGVGDYTEAVKGFIEKLELENVVIIGHSFGGRVGIKLASIYPGLINKLVLVDSAGFAMEPNKKSVIGAVAKIAKPFFKPKFMQGLRKKIYQFIGAEDYVATPSLQKTFVNIVNEDLTEEMKHITIPTLIIWGEDDKETPLEFGQRMYSLISVKGGPASGGRNSKFEILHNAGHFSFLDKQKEFVKILTDFI